MKNKMMRIASVLLVAALITTCAISGTFAKYVTKVSGEDSARVAKWGIVLDIASDGIFADKYEAEDDAYIEAGGEYSVEALAAEGAEAADKVVAPGTNSEQVGTTLVASVKGTPEVATRYTLTGSVEDIVLPAGTGYTDYTELVKGDNGYGYTKTFDLAKDYAPVKWNMVISKGSTELNVADALYANLPSNLITVAENYGLTPNGCSFFDAVKILAKVATKEEYKQVVDEALGQIVNDGRNFQLEVTDDGFTLSYDFDPNKVMDFTFELTWEWAFEQENVELYDKADTLLGNIAAGICEAPEGANTVIGATLTATAVQID
jgi:hypothetical protein